MTTIDPKLARKLTLDEITAGCVQELQIPIGALRGKEARYSMHRAVWYAVLLQMTGMKSDILADHVGRHRSGFFRAIAQMGDAQKGRVARIVAMLQSAEFGG